MKHKILVTGGAGFIGSFLVDKLIEKGHDLTIFDNLTEQVHHGKIPSYLNKKAKFVNADLRNYEELKKYVLDSEIIFNFAARVGVGQSMYEIKDYCEVNQQGTANLLHVLANEEHDVKKVIVASSMSIYGEGSYKDPETGEIFNNVERSIKQLKNKKWEPKSKTGNSLVPIPTSEEKETVCKSIYAISKKNQEETTMNVCEVYGIPSVALRFFNTYGPRQALSNPYSGVAAMFMSRIKNNKPPVIFEDGMQLRSLISVHDIIHANILSMEKNSANHEVFNVGGEEVTSVKEMAETLIDIYDSNLIPEINGQFRVGDIRHCFADITKIKSKLGFEQKIKLKEGLQELVSWAEDKEAKDLMDNFMQELRNKKLL